MPPDRHTGRPLNYVLRDGRPVLYSVGVNLVDDGGSPGTWKTSKTGGTIRVERWLHADDLAARRRDDPGSIPDGDWVLYPPSLAREAERGD